MFSENPSARLDLAKAPDCGGSLKAVASDERAQEIQAYGTASVICLIASRHMNVPTTSPPPAMFHSIGICSGVPLGRAWQTPLATSKDALK
jgi:hypothetical protein